jgi:hypothetical protein
MCGYVVCVPECRGSVCCVFQVTQKDIRSRLLPKRVGASI